MKYCSGCGNLIDDAAAFCGYCGTACVAPDYERALQEECLHTLYHRLCTERKVWRIFAFVFLGFTIFFFLFALFFAMIGEDIGAAFSVMYIMYALILFLPICIINFVVVSKLNYYVDSYYVDIGPTIERCGNAGAIVLGALCNEIALIFIIINFVYIKRNAAVFRQIRANQLAANQVWGNTQYSQTF